MSRELYLPSYYMLGKQEQIAEQHPLTVVREGTDLLQHLKGAEKFWVDTRDQMLSQYPRQKTFFVVIWGRTGVGKRQAAAQLLYLSEKDPALVNTLEQRRIEFRRVYVSFASSANLARLRGDINPAHGHGHYTDIEYRNASKVHWEFTSKELNNFEGLTMVVIEPSGPSGIFKRDGSFVGKDRALSTVKLLSKYEREATRILVIKRGKGLEEKIVNTRKALMEASWDQMANIITQANLQIFKNGEPINVIEMSEQDLESLRVELLETMAPPEGVMASNRNFDRFMHKHYRTRSEKRFWEEYLREFGWLASDFDIVTNRLTRKPLALHIGYPEKFDPMQPEIKDRKRLISATA